MSYPKLTKTVALTLVTIALSANAQTTLIDEDFNNPAGGATNGTNLSDDTTNFPEWNFNDADQYTYLVGPQDGAPVSAGDGYVKIDTFSSFGNVHHAQYDTGHNWSATDQFTLSLNATEQNWGNTNDRFMVISIKETSRTGTELTGATLWTVTEELVYDANHDHVGGDTWGPNNTFSWTFNAADFTTGTEGTAISFEISGTGSRGYHFDNVLLTTSAVPEPSAFALLAGIFGLTWVMVRRR